MRKMIKTQEDYQQALERLEQLMDAGTEPNSPEAEELEFLRLTLKDFETKKFESESGGSFFLCFGSSIFQRTNTHTTLRSL